MVAKQRHYDVGETSALITHCGVLVVYRRQTTAPQIHTQPTPHTHIPLDMAAAPVAAEAQVFEGEFDDEGVFHRLECAA